jgi:glycosyltransferase involved in cell wall biosynthesis
MITVAHVITCLGAGGTERQLVTLLSALPRERWRSLVFALRLKGEHIPTLRAMGIEPREVRLGDSLARPATLQAVARLARALRQDNVALVHCHDLYSDVIGVAAARAAGLPVIASRRDLAHHVSRALRPALTMALRGATRVLCNAATVAAQVEADDGVPAGRLAVIPNGIDLSGYAAVSPTRGARPTVLMVGRMAHAIKGHDDLIEAAARVPGARFLLAGDGPREPVLRAAARTLSNVTFLGARDDVPALLATADVVCHPARAEGFPNAVLEAMAAGRPIVAAAAGGIPEMIHDGVHGLLCPPGDPPRLASALRSLLDAPTRAAALGRAARARVAQRFTTARLVARTEALYADMMPACSRRSSSPAI